MKAIRRTLAVLLAPALLAACAGPLPGAVVPPPGTLGLGPDCGPQAYPFQALHNFVRGQVVVRGQVAADGRITGAVAEQPAWDPYLTAAALDGVRHCRLPASPAGTVVRLLFVYDFVGGDQYLPRGVVTVLFAPPA